MGYSKPAYLLSDRNLGERETSRLSLAAEMFIELEFEKLKPFLSVSKRIADIGCGTGEIARAIALTFRASQVYGFDLDPISLEKSAEQARDIANLMIHPWELGAPQLPVGVPFDFVLIRLVLLHLSRPEERLSALLKVLKKGSFLYLVDVDDRDMFFDPVEPWQKTLLSIMQEVQTKLGGTRHLGRELGSLLDNVGLTQIHTEKVMYSKQAIGSERYKAMALPVYQYYLDVAQIDKADAEQIEEALKNFLDNPSAELKIGFWHAVGQL